MPRRLWRTTFGLVTIVALCFAGGTIAIGAIAYVVTHEALEVQLDHRVAGETSALIAEASEDGIAGVADAIRRRAAARSTSSLDYLLVDAQGHRLAGTFDVALPATRGYVELLPYRRGDRRGIAQSLVTQIAGGTLVVGADRRDLDEIDDALARLFALSLAATLALGIVAAALVGWATRRRLARIDGTAQAIIAGDLSQRVPRDGSASEFDRLAATLNRMLDRIEALMDNLRQVSSDVAHDLRTPLTRLQNQLDIAASAPDEGERMAAIEAARRQSVELLEIFAALLRIAEVEGLAERRTLALVDLSALIDEMAETYRPDFEATEHRLQVAVPPGLSLRGDRRLLAQAIANLLDNTLRHTPDGTTVTIAATRHEKQLELVVSDDGPGIDPTLRDRAFQRFARSEASRTTDGNGLGLALVQAVAAAHGGKATILEQAVGLGIALRLPV